MVKDDANKNDINNNVILLSFAAMNMGLSSSGSTSGKVDLFTQKAPFNGKGP